MSLGNDMIAHGLVLLGLGFLLEAHPSPLARGFGLSLKIGGGLQAVGGFIVVVLRFLS